MRRRGEAVELIDAKAVNLPMLDRMYKEYPPGKAPEQLQLLAGKIRDAGLWCVYEFAWQLDAIRFWDRFEGRWLRGSEFHYPERPKDLPTQTARWPRRCRSSSSGACPRRTRSAATTRARAARVGSTRSATAPDPGAILASAMPGSPDQRAILVLRDSRGLDYEQIAEVLPIWDGVNCAATHERR